MGGGSVLLNKDYLCRICGRRSALQRAWNIFLAICVVIAAALAVAFAGVRLIGLTPYAVLTGSMEPELPVGSLIFVRSVDPADIQVGDDITFKLQSGSLATHQVWKVDTAAQTFYTQGIANKDQDGNIMHDGAPVAWSNVVGSPVFCIPYLGYINRFCTTPPGMYILVAAVALVIAVSIVVELANMRPESAKTAPTAAATAATEAPAPAGGHFRRSSASADDR